MPPPSKPLPRHRAIADALRVAIRKGKYPVGSQLPTEEALTLQFGASRPTVRNALGALAQEGLIVRRTRVGSTVVASKPADVLAQQVNSIEELLAYPAGTYRKLIGASFVKTDAATSSTLRCAAGTDWFLISMFRFAGDSPVPICWTDMYIQPQYAGVTRHAQHLTLPVCNQIEEMFGVQLDGASLEVFASGVPQHMAAELQTKAGSPALVIVRRYRDSEGSVFEISVSVHPEKRYRMNFELQRERRAPRLPA